MTEAVAHLEFCDVKKSFASGDGVLEILKGLNFRIDEGETVAITGPSGSGKSTLLNLMAGLDRVSSGQILLKGQTMQEWNEDQLAHWRRTDVGFIFQDFRLIPSFTALENVTLPLELLGWKVSDANARAHSLLKDLGLHNREHHFPHQLSGGEQQRVAIARAFSHKPSLILADEPTGNLDPVTSETVLGALMEMNSAEKTTLAMVTHDMDNARRMSRYVKILGGQIAPQEEAA
jgi:putative ABC transport system ATP-binding protein